MTKNTKPTEDEKVPAEVAPDVDAEKLAAEAAEAEKLAAEAAEEAEKGAELVDVVLSKDSPVAALVFPGLGRATRDVSIRVPAAEFERLRDLYALEMI